LQERDELWFKATTVKAAEDSACHKARRIGILYKIPLAAWD
jgi:hypothetical protein